MQAAEENTGASYQSALGKNWPVQNWERTLHSPPDRFKLLSVWFSYIVSLRGFTSTYLR